MKTLHVVRQGEYLQQIAFRHGLTVDEVWAEPDNAVLRRERGEASAGSILHPGDVLVIPEHPPPRPLTIAAGEHRELVVSLPRVPVQLTLGDGERRLADIPFRVDEPGRVVRGASDADGLVQFDVGLLTHHVRLTVEAPEGDRVYDLEVGGLDPIQTITGQQQRLHQLGHYRGRIAGVMDAATRAAIRVFIARVGCAPADWLEALREAYGC